jgi:hypothetical protein
VPGDPGRQLLDILQRELIGGLHEAVAQIASELETLAVDDAFDGTAFADRALAPVDAASPVLGALRAFTSAAAAGADGQLRGWRDEVVDDAARGVAYVARAGPSAAAAARRVAPALRVSR